MAFPSNPQKTQRWPPPAKPTTSGGSPHQATPAAPAPEDPKDPKDPKAGPCPETWEILGSPRTEETGDFPENKIHKICLVKNHCSIHPLGIGPIPSTPLSPQSDAAPFDAPAPVDASCEVPSGSPLSICS